MQLTGSIPITVRHLESMIRMAEAHARMHLRDYVHDEGMFFVLCQLACLCVAARTLHLRIRKLYITTAIPPEPTAHHIPLFPSACTQTHTHTRTHTQTQTHTHTHKKKKTDTHTHTHVHTQNTDLNLAIRVMLESFISTQKVAAVNRLRTKLAKFLTYKKDHNERLLHVLNGVLAEHIAYLQARSGIVPDVLEVDMEDFEVQVFISL